VSWDGNDFKHGGDVGNGSGRAVNGSRRGTFAAKE